MMKQVLLFTLILALLLCFAACESTQADEQSTTAEAEVTTEQPSEQSTTAAPETTESETTQEETTEKAVVIHPTREQIKEVASTVLEIEDIFAAANNAQQDWSDFGGLTQNEDGSLTALFRMGTNDIWDPYFYLIKQDTVVDNILVIQYRSDLDQMLNMYMGTEGNAATGVGDHVGGDLYATDGDWGYLILDLTKVADCYDPAASYLGYIRFGLTMAESGDTVDFGFIAFFHTMEQVNMIIPQ